MKKLLYLTTLTILISSCSKFLDRQPLDSASSETFLATDAELNLGITGVYAAAHWSNPNQTPLLFAVDATTDYCLKRTGNDEDNVALGEGKLLISNGLTVRAWQQAYNLVSRANTFLDGMVKGKATTSATLYNKTRSEALVLRAWAYYHIMGWFGDPIYYRTPLDPAEYEKLTRTPIATVVAELYKDLDEAYSLYNQSGIPATLEAGRVNKGVALGLKGKLALLIKDYPTAVASNKAVMDLAVYGLNAKYPDLFSYNGQISNSGKELMFLQPYPTDVTSPNNISGWLSIPRQVTGSQSSIFPTQNLVDQYEDTKGNRIDQSTSYDKAYPQKSRDKRLGWTIYMHGDTMTHRTANAASGNYIEPKQRTIFNIYTNVVSKYNWVTKVYDGVVTNIDLVDNKANSLWQYGATGTVGGLGYLWRKWSDTTFSADVAKVGFVNMRYAEILLNYAEAKIESNSIDQSVVDAINLVRVRSGQPAITLQSQAAMRTILRREKSVEFAGEGLRLFDARRWGIVAKAFSFYVAGTSFSLSDPANAPSFDENNIPDYTASLSKRITARLQTRNNAATKFNLWPIPQGEIDKNKNIVQNAGW